MAVKTKVEKTRPPVKRKTAPSQNRQLPPGWSVWAPDQAVLYDVGIDEVVRFEGQPAACIESMDVDVNPTIWLVQVLDTSGYRGKRIRWRGHIKSKNVTDSAVFWLDVLTANNTRLAMDNMADRQIKATTDWTKCELVVDVPADALFIRLSCSLAGTGSAWFAGMDFGVVDESVPNTDTYALGCRGIWCNHPINIDLSEREDNLSYLDDQWPGVLPKGWLRWGMPAAGYEMGMDSRTKHSNKHSGTIKSLHKMEETDFGNFTQKFGAPTYRGKRVRLTGYTKTKSVTGYCGLTMRVLDIYSGDLAAENTYDMGGTGTNDWTKREIVMDVPAHAGVLSIGASLFGAGQMWFDGLAFEEVGEDVPLTYSEHRVAPRNMDFALTVAQDR